MFKLTLLVLISTSVLFYVRGEDACPSYASHANGKCVLYNNYMRTHKGGYSLYPPATFCKELNGKLLEVEDMPQMEQYMSKLVSVLDKNYPGETRGMKNKQKLLIGKIGNEDGCHFVEWNANKKQWISEKSSCDDVDAWGKPFKGYQVGSVCQFPAFSFQEYKNVADCGLPERDLIHERLTEWPDHIEIGSNGEPMKIRQKRVIHGIPSNLKFWPWYVRMTYGGGALACGASLIHPRLVITARHCGENKTRAFNFGYDPSIKNFQNLTVKFKPDEHTEYIYKGGYIDVKIHVLKKPVTLVKGRIQPICLPEWGHAAFPKENFAFVGGYGATNGQTWPGKDRDSNIQQLQLWLQLRNSSDVIGQRIPSIIARPANKTLRAGVNGHRGDVGSGDSGGPIMFRGKDEMRWKLAAPVSYSGNMASSYLGYLKPWLDLKLHKLKVEGHWSD